ncbi:MAG: hypothetical protein DDG60_16485 [Anaerolineae bacterium]|nr:MAG: hypothetical protein DDG60_16485 [Anaerolineae bacterium]
MTDLRKYASQTTLRLVLGALLILFTIGIALIGLIYGLGAAVMGFLCLLGALLPIGLVWLALFGLDVVVKRLNRDE